MELNLNKYLIERRINAAQGKILCDLIIKNIYYLDVFSCKWRKGEISIVDGVIVGLDSGLQAKRVIDGKEKWIVPGFIDAHVHIESSLLIPRNFQKVVLPHGTTTAICDPHELTNVLGTSALQYFLEEASSLDLDLRVMLSSCVPATHLETNGAGTIDVNQLLPFVSHPKTLGLAEVMNVPSVLNNDSLIIDKILAFSQMPMDGHCPRLKGKSLAAYASTGISSCHETSTADEALEKIKNGMSVWIREGSVAKDLNALIHILNAETSSSIGFCTDDRNPLDIAVEGHLDFMIRTAIQKHNIPAEIVYRSASWSVARHYGLRWKGALAPGYHADFVILDDPNSCAISSVVKSGVFVSELSEKGHLYQSQKNTIYASVPSHSDLEGPTGLVHVIGVQKGSILSEHLILNHDSKGVAKLSVVERYGKNSKPANAYVQGFGEYFKGALASSVGHDSHNLITVGSNVDDMNLALSFLIKSGGGFCAVQNGSVLAKLDLPVGGLMSNNEPVEIETSLRSLLEATTLMGCELPEPFLQLAFLSLPVIPKLKLTDKGLVDVDAFKIIDVRA